MTFDVPSSLPEIDAVEVVVLRDVKRGPEGYMPYALSAPSAMLRGADGAHIAKLWRALPPGVQARCHVPPFGLRFFANDTLLCEASLCWQCNNVWGIAGDDPFGFQFDASHPTSRALLEACERATAGQ